MESKNVAFVIEVGKVTRDVMRTVFRTCHYSDIPMPYPMPRDPSPRHGPKAWSGEVRSVMEDGPEAAVSDPGKGAKKGTGKLLIWY